MIHSFKTKKGGWQANNQTGKSLIAVNDRWCCLPFVLLSRSNECRKIDCRFSFFGSVCRGRKSRKWVEESERNSGGAHEVRRFVLSACVCVRDWIYRNRVKTWLRDSWLYEWLPPANRLNLSYISSNDWTCTYAELCVMYQTVFVFFLFFLCVWLCVYPFRCSLIIHSRLLFLADCIVGVADTRPDNQEELNLFRRALRGGAVGETLKVSPVKKEAAAPPDKPTFQLDGTVRDCLDSWIRSVRPSRADPQEQYCWRRRKRRHRMILASPFGRTKKESENRRPL